MKIINPSTGKLIKSVKEDSNASAALKHKKARVAQTGWAARSLDDRLACIQRFSGLLEKNKEQLARDLTEEVGKPFQESLNEINGARTKIQFFLDQSKKWLTEGAASENTDTKEVLSFDALGVIANISAWNYPYLVGCNIFIPALIAGSAVLYKPSEYATITGLNIVRLMHEAGVPKEVFASLVGGQGVGKALLDLPLDGYFFTGSYKTGKYIAEKVAHKLVPVGLELGGKDPLYVTDDVVDLKKVAAQVLDGCFYNNGQSCCAVERVYVHEKVYDEFIDHFLAEARNLKTGAVTRAVHLDFLESQVRDAVKKGAKVLIGGKRQKGTGNFFQPTVLGKVTHKMRVMTEETFGPVVGVMKVKNDDEAIQLMNDCEYGLTAAVYSKDLDRAKKIVSRVNAGTSYINCCDRVSGYLPWSGRKHSGLGTTLSYIGILTFTKPRAWHMRQS